MTDLVAAIIAQQLARIADVLEWYRAEHERLHGRPSTYCEVCGRVSGHGPGCERDR